jgi:hypothetical protein
MKTLNLYASSLVCRTKALGLLTGFILLFTSVQGQIPYRLHNESIGISASALVNADGYGTQYAPMVYYKRDRQFFHLGVLIQDKKQNFSGLQFEYTYTIVGEDAPMDISTSRNMELFFFVSTAYHYKALLGSGALSEEHQAAPKLEGGDPCKLLLNSAEAFGGFGLKVRLYKSLKWVSNAGIGGYTSFGCPAHMFYEGSSIGFMIKTGLSIDLFRRR